MFFSFAFHGYRCYTIPINPVKGGAHETENKMAEAARLDSAVGLITPVIALMVVDFPAPL